MTNVDNPQKTTLFSWKMSMEIPDKPRYNEVNDEREVSGGRGSGRKSRVSPIKNKKRGN